jgi:phosphonate transport system ATP-binding protein
MIRVTDLSVQFGQLTALDAVTLELRRGEITVLLGRSGAGKSTLLRCLNYLQVPSSGAVEIEGIGPLSDRRNLCRHRRRTGTVFQLHHLLPRQSALKNVLAGRLGYRSTLRSLLPWPRADVAFALECLDRVGLLSRAMCRADQLSGGERQRVGIARALCQNPDVLLADEPVASLDPATAEQVLTLLCQICRQSDVTLVMSLHQLEHARRFADRIVGLMHGQVVFDGPPAALNAEQVRAVYGSVTPAHGDAVRPSPEHSSPIHLPGELSGKRASDHDPTTVLA